jgi:hypothetical protein
MEDKNTLDLPPTEVSPEDRSAILEAPTQPISYVADPIVRDEDGSAVIIIQCPTMPDVPMVPAIVPVPSIAELTRLCIEAYDKDEHGMYRP